MADFRPKSRYLKKLLTDFNNFWLRRCRLQVASLDSIKDIIDHRSRSQRSNNGSKIAKFRLKSRYLKKLLIDLNDFWLKRCTILVASLNVIKNIINQM